MGSYQNGILSFCGLETGKVAEKWDQGSKEMKSPRKQKKGLLPGTLIEKGEFPLGERGFQDSEIQKCVGQKTKHGGVRRGHAN